MKRAIICDIDQCLLNSLVPVEMKNIAKNFGQGLTEKQIWDNFYNNLHLCKRNEWCFELIEQMTIQNDIKIIFITGREERAREATEDYFKFSHPIDWELHMRPNGCLDEDVIIKSNIMKELIGQYEFIFALDDREANCKVYQAFGITTLQVTSA
jgi:hypothetical protein